MEAVLIPVAKDGLSLYVDCQRKAFCSFVKYEKMAIENALL